MPDDLLPDRSPLLTGQPSAPDPAEPIDAHGTPYLELAELAIAWKFNARESGAYALGWLRAQEPATLPAHFRVRMSRDQMGAALAILLDAGFQLATFATHEDGGRTVRVSY